jgi:small conductance mechanosensitive channel
MPAITAIRTLLADGRFDANLITIYGLIVVVVLASLAARRMVAHGSRHLFHWTRLTWLDPVEGGASRRARSAISWLSVLAVAVIVAGGIVYHHKGRDVRADVQEWYDSLSAEELIALGLKAISLGAIILATTFGVRTIRRFQPRLEARLVALVSRAGDEGLWRSWFTLSEYYTVAAIRLLGMFGVCVLIEWHHAASAIAYVGFVATVIVLARLVTLACRGLSHTAIAVGNRYLSAGPFQRYWERLTRLFPFGVKCLEAAVYVSAASLCVSILHFIFAGILGLSIVKCIGILFGTRAVIELLQVLLNQAFGLYDEEAQQDQKAKTLVPLLNSVCQYTLYFGSAVWMLGTLGMDTKPILAGAGILGLAVGLGAQNLVTDLVSGFFILFEGQYLVGDWVQVNDAAGTVEAVGIRLTQIRDPQGKLFIIPNGQIKAVVSYSKGFVNAVVDYKAPAGSDLESVFRAMTEAGKRLRQARSEVVADTQVQGLVDLGNSDMTVRAVTRVKPGTHIAMQNEYRRMLKLVLDEKAVPKSAAA